MEEANSINVSPLPAIRNSYQNVFNFETECPGDQPVIRMEPIMPRSCVVNRGYSPANVLKRRNGNIVPKRKLLSTVRQTAKILKPKLPVVRDVNVIDYYFHCQCLLCLILRIGDIILLNSTKNRM